MRKPITKKEIETLGKNSSVRLIDVRSNQEYDDQHIPLAINIPKDELPTALEQFSKADTFICVCNHGGNRSKSAAEYLFDHGFENAFYLEGGTAGWFEGDR